MNLNNSEVLDLLRNYKKICFIGLSSDPFKAANQIPLYMKSHGYQVVGVNPKYKSVDGIDCYSSLDQVPAEFRVFVDVFRPPPDIPGVVQQVLKAGGVEVLWLQLGITHPEAEADAEASGIKVVSNRCLLIEHKKIR